MRESDVYERERCAGEGVSESVCVLFVDCARRICISKYMMCVRDRVSATVCVCGITYSVER